MTTKPIKLVISDVDGVLTDGGMYYTESGDELKRFNTRDGMGFQLLREAGLQTAIITSEDTAMVTRRARKMKIDHLRQGKRDGGKLEAAQEICATLGIELDEVAYVGDDLNCLALLRNVGKPACPRDAVAEVRRVPEIVVLDSVGGGGALREFAELILAELVPAEER